MMNLHKPLASGRDRVDILFNNTEFGRRWHDNGHDTHGGYVRRRGEEEEGSYADCGGCIVEERKWDE
jgi:hypothetical protein